MQWYFQSKTSEPAVCENHLAMEGCATSCESKLECFEGVQTEQIYFAWDRIRRIEPVHTNGSVCLAQGLKKNDIIKACTTWCVCVCVCVRACVRACARALECVCVCVACVCARLMVCAPMDIQICHHHVLCGCGLGLRQLRRRPMLHTGGQARQLAQKVAEASVMRMTRHWIIGSG